MSNGIPFRWFGEIDEISNVMHAAIQGAANFTPAMLPNLWSGHPCPYSNPLYREAWYRGFYSAACWYLIDRVAAMGRTWKPDLGKMFEYYCQERPAHEWLRVPGGKWSMPEMTEPLDDLVASP